MANRTVSVRLLADVGGYVSGMNAAAASTVRLGDSATKSTAQAKSGFDIASKGALLMGAAVVGGMAVAISKSMEFEKSMSAVAAATGAATGVLGDLREAAMKAGADTAFSATEAADAITEMAKAGVSAKDIMGGGLTGALSLAAAGQIDVAEAAGIAATAMTQFSLSGEDLPHVADLLAAGAGKAMGSVDDLGQALNQAGLIASAAGLSIEETTGGLAAFASAGLIGSDAGTSFKTMLQALQAPTEKSAGIMADLGINMYDAQGNMLGLGDMAGQLQTHLSGLTEEQRNSALATIFGSDAVRAANVLYKEGEQGIDEWTAKVNDSGYAAEQAAALQDNLAGDLEKLGGSFDTLMISIGEGLQGPLRGLVQFFGTAVDGATGLIGVFSDLPGPVQAAIGAFGLWAVAGSKVGDVFGSVQGKIRAFRDELQLQQSLLAMQSTNMSDADRALGGLGATAEGTSKKFGMVSTAIGGFARAIGPELAVGAAIYAITSIAGSIDTIAHAGDGARSEVQDLERSLGDIDDNDARIHATADAIVDLTHKLADAKALSNDNRDFGAGIGVNPLAMASAIASYQDASAAVDVYQQELDKLEASSRRSESATQTLSEKFHLTGDEVLNLASKYGIDLSGSLSETRRLFENFYTAEFGTTPVDAANATSTAMQSAMAQTEAAKKAQEDFVADVAEGMASFVEPLAVYTGLLQDKAQAEADAANATAEKTGAATQSWTDFKDSVHVTFAEYMADLQAQVDAQANWQTNMLLLAGRVSQGTLDELARMGPEGAPLVAELVTKSDAELAQFSGLAAQRSQEATDAWSAKLAAAAPVLAAVAKVAGQGVVNELAAQLQAGTTTVAAIMARYGINIAGGINPILAGLGKPRIFYNAATGAHNETGFQVNADGNLYESHQAEIARGGAMRLWAEPETGGEAYIPLSPAKRGRSLNIWEETGKRLGVDMETYANGGIRAEDGSMVNSNFYSKLGPGISMAEDGSLVKTSSFYPESGGWAPPKPPSTAPFQMPISTAADAAMDKMYTETISWLDAQAAAAAAASGGALGSGAVGGGWQAIFNWVKARVPQARANSTYRAGDPGYHGKGKAVDFGFGSAPGGNGSAGLALINRTLHDGLGANLAELIYDGVGDDRPDLKNGKPLTYSAATRAEHHNHVHAATYDQGGPLRPGYTLAYNGTGKTEWVSKEMPGGGWSGSGSGSGGGMGPITVFAQFGDETIEARATRIVIGALTTGTNRARNNP